MNTTGLAYSDEIVVTKSCFNSSSTILHIIFFFGSECLKFRYSVRCLRYCLAAFDDNYYIIFLAIQQRKHRRISHIISLLFDTKKFFNFTVAYIYGLVYCPFNIGFVWLIVQRELSAWALVNASNFIERLWRSAVIFLATDWRTILVRLLVSIKAL